LNRILFLDLNNILYGSFYALKNLRNSKNINIGGIFGFCKKLNSLINKFNPDSIYCFDD